MQTRVLRARDITDMASRLGFDALMDRMIERLRGAFVDYDPAAVDIPVREGFNYEKPALGLVEWMPVHQRGGPVVIKMVGYHPTNPVQRSIPSVLATSSMWDTETGHLVAVSDATLLTALRTGAASAIATDFLAIDEPITLGVIGLGAQSVTQVHAISRVRKIDRVIGYDADDLVAASFATRLSFLDPESSTVETVEIDGLPGLVAAADVLCTCTSVDIGAGPVIPESDHRPWLHVNAVGADFPGKTEIPRGLLERALVVPDSRDQCRVEGECQQLDDDGIGPSLAYVAANASHFEPSRNQLTVFDSTGWAIEDEVALRLALDIADELGLGQSIGLEAIGLDPYDPYGELR